MGRYVYVFIERRESVALTEVEVYGTGTSAAHLLKTKCRHFDDFFYQ